MVFKLTINCCFCESSHVAEIETPSEWITYYDGDEIESGFCEKHAAVKDFADSQCPGCVGNWMDCGLWRSFAYSHEEKLTEDDFELIRNGICPKRVNGTLHVRVGNSLEMENIDLPNRASSESGAALERAIREYMEIYLMSQLIQTALVQKPTRNPTNQPLAFPQGLL